VSESITFKHTLTEADFVSAYRAYVRSKRSWWITWALMFGLAPGMYVFMSYGGIPQRHSLAVALFLGAMYGALFWWSFSVHPRRAARSSPFLNVEMEVTVSSEGLKWQSILAKGEAGWAAYIGGLESADHFLLFGGKNLYYLYPKRGISTPEAMEKLRALLRAHVPNFATKRSGDAKPAS